jgi:pimeloyl-ACP methyl ester carboxylesterase
VQAQWTDRFVTGHGIKIHVGDWGSEGKFPMLLIHGFSQTAHTWDEFASAVRDRHHVDAMDQRGHGDSDWAAKFNPRRSRQNLYHRLYHDLKQLPSGKYRWKYDPVFRAKEWSERREAIGLWSYFRKIARPTRLSAGPRATCLRRRRENDGRGPSQLSDGGGGRGWSFGDGG